MKKLFFIVIGIVFLITGCETSTDSGTNTQHYYYEAFTISITDYYSVPQPANNFNSIKNWRNQLRIHIVEFLESGANLTQSELYDYLTQRGVTPSDANREISFLNSIGNNYYAGPYIPDSNLAIFIYIEKI